MDENFICIFLMMDKLEKRSEKMMRHLDTDGNGELSIEELSSRPPHKNKEKPSIESS